MPTTTPGVRVQDVMTRRVATARRDQSLHEIWYRLAEERCHHLPIVDDDDRVVGMISSRDLIRVARHLGVAKLSAAAVGEVAAGEVMNEGLETIAGDEPIERAIERIGEGDLHALVVLDDAGGLSGIVTDRDLLDYMLD